ncbi:MAG: hypothetical protein KF819_38395 [Labilithrix sp.]|nr:hypothetical protein [Labilithrix sp.]
MRGIKVLAALAVTVGAVACSSQAPAENAEKSEGSTAGAVRREGLGPACGDDYACASGECYFWGVLGEGLGEYRCVAGNPCDLVTCPSNAVCAINESNPAQVVCAVLDGPPSDGGAVRDAHGG